VDPRLDLFTSFAGDRQELDLVTQLLRKFYVFLGDSRYSLAAYTVYLDFLSVGEGKHDGEFVCRVDTLDVESRVGLGKTEALGLLQDLGEGLSFVRHFRQDVVGGSVHYTQDGLDPIRHQALFQRLDDRDGSADARFEADVDVFLFGGPEYLVSVSRQERLVRRNDVFLRLDSL